MSRYLLHRSVALGAITAMMATADAAASAPVSAKVLAAKRAENVDPTPSLKENIGRVPKFTTEGIYCRPGERAMTRDKGDGWKEVNQVALPAAVPQGELPAGIPPGSVQAMGGQWMVPLANGTFAMLGSQTIPDASVSKEEAASELGLAEAATAGATIIAPEGNDTEADAAEKRRAVEDEVNGLTVPKLKEELTAAGIAFEGDANKPTLQKLVLAHRLKG